MTIDGTVTIVVACALTLVMTPLGLRQVLAATAVALLVTTSPLVIVPIGLAASGVLLARHLRARTDRDRASREDRAALAELTAIGLTGGLAIQPSLEIAARGVGGPIAAETRALLLQARIRGMAAAMAGAPGQSRDFYRAIGRTAATGSSLVDTVIRIADEAYANINAARMQEVRRLPVTMLFPLTLLILPGFMLLTVAPALLDAFARLEM